MDKGAHFYCCDFQVHSPRDRQWSGFRPGNEEERKQYASSFVKECRQKGLNAVAITDHHDLLFVDFIRKAAQEEQDPNGNLYPEHERLVVYPGMELTLGIPCQAIIIFDADLPCDLFTLALNALALTQAPDDSPVTEETRRLESITSISELCEQLDRHKFLQGRYIILPNVSEGGTSTLLRSGHAGHYKDMPCVGGYLDGKIEQLGNGNKRITEGKNPDYGNKRIALFQTSDARSENFAQLGSATTWVKWATPTAEALRQACLAQESRITQLEPYIPPVQIQSLQVSNSKFLGPIVVMFNPQYNAIIGGRGTGKSTILEYLRWGLCDEAVIPGDFSSDFSVKSKTLIEKTLLSQGGNVQVTFVLNKVQHVLRRNSTTNELLLKVGGADFVPCKETDIRSLLSIQYYGQKQLSQVGVRLEELNRFVKQGISLPLNEISKRLNTVKAEIRTLFSSILQKRDIQKTIDNNKTELSSLEEQLKSTRSSLQGLDENDQKIISLQGLYEEADEYISGYSNALEQIRNSIDNISIPVFDDGLSEDELFPDLPDRGLVWSYTTEAKQFVTSLQNHLKELQAELQRLVNQDDPLKQAHTRWREAKDSYQQKYEDSKLKSSAHENTLKQLQELENRVRIIKTNTVKLNSDLEIAGNPEVRYLELRNLWIQLHRDRAALLEAQCHDLTTFSGGLIRAKVKKCADYEDVLSRLKAIVQGSRIHTEKLETIFNSIANSPDPILEWSNCLEEISLLLLKESTAARPATPVLNSLGFSSQELDKIVIKFTDDIWLDLSLMILDDLPVFEYRTREAEYIPFADASAGQQATALLWALLNQDGPPLIIDQPEDDLDNQVISNVVEQIWKAKPKRQLIFASHNANLVVNGDAELVICCDYKVAGDHSTGEITQQGAIDIKDVRVEITKIMEGGEAAFKLRKDKYGF